eukprot:TRINITY_DN3612_c0_g1_i1.p1 TRINITY_DN3612_c0_g1~~TRINITY_DN3612_c0_g1_i1.p1  ORF type:complete len:370 (-),score=95.95 TRINITY_DN3612_c0_g1_i1:56-1165(-)
MSASATKEQLKRLETLYAKNTPKVKRRQNRSQKVERIETADEQYRRELEEQRAHQHAVNLRNLKNTEKILHAREESIQEATQKLTGLKPSKKKTTSSNINNKMVKYMVSVDDSDSSTEAFYTALSLSKKESDELYIIHIVQHAVSSFPLSGEITEQMQAHANNEGKRILAKYARLAKASGIHWSTVLGVSNHVGEMICNQVDNKGIDVLIMGRRGMGAIKRMLVGSVSRYCTEHARCAVMVIKSGETEGSKALEVQSDLQAVVQEEEHERKKQMKEKIEADMDEQGRRKFESALDRNIAVLSEETERLARIQDDQELQNKLNRELGKVPEVMHQAEVKNHTGEDLEHRMELLEQVFAKQRIATQPKVST